ncbi:TPA: hypothetical protein DDW35_11925 [Candidatus Sumerlaeota bacterium]|nr:hypothetical protein [Candidatus Sumerlaeota bacterium]
MLTTRHFTTHPKTRSIPWRGVTLVEAVIAISILSVMMTAIISTMIASSKFTRLNSNAVMAKNIAQGFFEMMSNDAFASVNGTNYVQGTTRVPATIYLDHNGGITCTVSFQFVGFGTVKSGSSGTTLNVSDASSTWQTNEWVGSKVYLVSGTGVGQWKNITANTTAAGTLSLTLDSAFSTTPDNTTRYMINNGKTVRVTTKWSYMGKNYSQTVGSLVTRYRTNDELGF